MHDNNAHNCMDVCIKMGEAERTIQFLFPAEQSWGGGYGVASNVRPSVRISFPKQISETHGGYFFNFAHTHPLTGVAVPFGVMKFDPPKLPTVGHK